jgi:hypothetical protein
MWLGRGGCGGGSHTFTVSAADNVGNPSSVTHT